MTSSGCTDLARAPAACSVAQGVSLRRQLLGVKLSMEELPVQAAMLRERHDRLIGGEV